MKNRGIEVIQTGFSVNIENDFKSSKKMNAYIPTEKNIKLLTKILDDIIEKREGSYILSGAYGSGKSFFISVLLNLLNVRKKEDIEVFLKKAEEKFPISKTYEKLQEDKYLVVFARDMFSSFEKAILHGILDTIKKEKIKITLNIESEVILKKIEEWEKNYPNIIKQFDELLNSKNKGIEGLKLDLSKNKSSAIKEFKKVYKDIFYGEEFINYETYFDITKLVSNFESEILKKTSYKGIIYVFDEFGRYLESNINKIDVKEVQDMAEYCNSDNSSYLFLVTHKDIFQYTNKLTRQDNIYEWEKVTGRFKKEQLFYDKVTALNILSHSFYKTDKFKDFEKKNKDNFDRYRNNLLNSRLVSQDLDVLIEEFYPLNYLAAYILPELSQKIAQNERTMFAFLNSNSKDVLDNLLKNNFLIGLDKIYDYFEENFKFLTHESEEYKSFFNAKKSLNMVDAEKEIKLIKSIAIIEIYNKYFEISPTKEILALALDCSVEELENILKTLQEKNIVVYKRNKQYFKIVEDSEINVENEVKDYIENKLTFVDYSEALNKYLALDYYYPVKYNYEKDITRYLKQIYLDCTNIDYLEKDKMFCDGEIVYLTNITNSNSYETIRKILNEKDIILIVNKENKRMNIDYILKELVAIEFLSLEEKCMNNISLQEEYYLYKEELISIINSELKDYFSLDNKDILYKGTKFEEKSLLDITYKYLSRKYPNYIEINYELMNKDKLSVPMKKVRSTLLDMLINCDKTLESEKFYQDTGAINSVARTVLRKIIDVDKGKISFIKEWKEIEKTIEKTVKEKSYSLEELYQDFMTEKNGYGLRKGILTLVLGIILIKRKDSIVVIDNSTKFKYVITSELIDQIEKNPENFYLSYVEKTKEEEEYLEDLKSMLGVYFVEDADIEVGVVEGIKNYFYSLNRYITGTILKSCKVLSKIFNILFQDKNPHEFLFKELLVRARTEDYKEIVKILKDEMKFIEEEKIKFELEIKKITLEALGNHSSYIEEALKIWQEKTLILDNRVKLWLKNYQYKTERNFLLDLTAKVKGFNYENWANINDIQDYKEKLDKLTKEVVEKETSKADVIEIVSGEEKIIVPCLKQHSQMGKMLKTKLQSAIKAIGLSVKDDEKKLILLEILKEL